MSRILHQSAEAGIWNHIFFFFGFPGETIEDAQETLNFIYRAPVLHPFGRVGHLFAGTLRAGPPLSQAGYGIERIVEPAENDLAIYFDYRGQSGNRRRDGRPIDVALYWTCCPDKRYGHYYVHDTYRFLYLSHLQEQGEPFPPWLVPEATTATDSGSAPQ